MASGSSRRRLTAISRLSISSTQTFNAYNAARFREACQLFTERILADDVTVGMSLSGAMTPAGLGMAAIIPLMRAGFIDWIVSTGANLYHDTHFGIGLEMRRGLANLDDRVLREEGVVRIYDIFFHYDVLLKTDSFFREMISGPEFQRTMSTAEFHHLAGKYVLERSRVLGLEGQVAARRRTRTGSSDLHLFAGRQFDRHECRSESAGRQQAAVRRQCRRERNGRHRVWRQERRATRAPS